MIDSRPVLTDIFAHRYEGVVFWKDFEVRDQRLIVQLFRLLSEQVCPYWVDGKASETGKRFWSELNKRLSMELGLRTLSDEYFSYRAGTPALPIPVTQRYPDVDICKNWMLAKLPSLGSADAFIKERLSLIELGFRTQEVTVAAEVTYYENPPDRMMSGVSSNFVASQRQKAGSKKSAFERWVHELNERFRQARYPLHYHNGFLQFSEDKAIESNVEAPFWALVVGPKWSNVDTDMKEAIDRRDISRRTLRHLRAEAVAGWREVAAA